MKQIFLGFFLLLVSIGVLYIIKFKPEAMHGDFSHILPEKISFKKQTTPAITIKEHTFQLLLAKTEAERNKGLSGKDSLPENTGMLFVFDTPYIEEFWMKEMRFPLDIIYIKNKHIITIFNRVPNPTTQNPLIHTVEPSQPADKVLEINAGLSEKYHFTVGDSVQISL